jgi:hypothetical protein
MSGIYAAGIPQATPPVLAAVEELRRTFGDCAVEATPDGEGGVFVIIRDVELGSIYAQPSTWLGFRISYLHPASDVYPHYIRADLARRDGQALGPCLSPTTWIFGNTLALQLSRRSNRWDPRRDTPALKALKVLAWLRESA